MTRNIFKLGLVALIAAFTLTPAAHAEEEEGENNFGTQLGAEITKKITSGLSVTLDEALRTRETLSTIDRVSSAIDISYKPLKYLKIGGAYNLINYNHETKGWEVRHRYYFYATGSYKFDRVSLSLREQFQSTKRVGLKEKSTRANPKTFLRSRLQAKWDIRHSRFEPFVSAEMYNSLNDPTGNGIDKWKFNVGTESKLNKRSSLQAFYRYVNFTDDDEGNGKHMLGLGYAYKF